MGTLLRTWLPLVLAATAACAGNTADTRTGTETGGDDDRQARLVVENRSSVDMDISARRHGVPPTPVGFAPANETTTFRLAPGLLAGAGTIHFEASPVRRQGEAVVSDPFNIGPGEEITWSIPPQ
jgi:hypothetical protein